MIVETFSVNKDRFVCRCMYEDYRWMDGWMCELTPWLYSE